MKTLGQATPYFIRCIKSNNEKVVHFILTKKEHFRFPIFLMTISFLGSFDTQECWKQCESGVPATVSELNMMWEAIPLKFIWYIFSHLWTNTVSFCPKGWLLPEKTYRTSCLVYPFLMPAIFNMEIQKSLCVTQKSCCLMTTCIEWLWRRLWLCNDGFVHL